ncbi:hypothetical protein B0H21DRAFT_736799 [Amylocystis lapponica]|nr:hypothetical protein B0H21DRAFT_736799 [Amylocystis lapponica]
MYLFLMLSASQSHAIKTVVSLIRVATASPMPLVQAKLKDIIFANHLEKNIQDPWGKGGPDGSYEKRGEDYTWFNAYDVDKGGDIDGSNEERD